MTPEVAGSLGWEGLAYLAAGVVRPDDPTGGSGEKRAEILPVDRGSKELSLDLRRWCQEEVVRSGLHAQLDAGRL